MIDCEEPEQRERRPDSVARFLASPKDAEDVPVRSLVKTPTGALAIVEGYRGFRRDHRIRLVCRYTRPVNKRFDVVLLLPELVVVLEKGQADGPQVEVG